MTNIVNSLNCNFTSTGWGKLSPDEKRDYLDSWAVEYGIDKAMILELLHYQFASENLSESRIQNPDAKSKTRSFTQR